MTVDTHIDHDHRVITVTLTGELTDAELLSLAAEVAKTPGIGKDFSLLLDLRFADGAKITTAGVRQMAARPLAFPATARRAVVVPSELGFGMARMYEMLRGEGAPRVFKDYDAARRWVETRAE
jgi:hypothetical protein